MPYSDIKIRNISTYFGGFYENIYVVQIL